MNDKNKEKYYELASSYILDGLEEKELDDFKNWLNESPANEKIFKEIKNAWNLSATINPRSKFPTDEGWAKFNAKRNTTSITFTITRTLKIAASLAIAFVLGALSYYFLNKTELKANLANAEMFETIVPNGSKTEMYLSDGTKVWLNAGTKLRYPPTFNPNERIVILDGEAYFDVAKDPKHPFIVKAGDVEVKAIGTAFNVKAYPSENTIETTLIEGKVVVSRKGANKPITLAPNQKLTYVKGRKDNFNPVEDISRKNDEELLALKEIKKTKNITLEEIADPKPVISWKEKEWFISGMNIKELSIKLERRYDVNIDIKDTELTKYRFTGTIMDESLEQVLTYMSKVAPINYKIDGKEVTFFANKFFYEKK